MLRAGALRRQTPLTDCGRGWLAHCAAACFASPRHSCVCFPSHRPLLTIFFFPLCPSLFQILLAARIIAAVENPEDVVVVSSRQFGQRSVFKYAQHTGAQYIGGRYTPGTLTNQVQRSFLEPRLLIVTDPITDHQVRSATRNSD